MTLLELIQAQEESRVKYRIHADYLEQMRLVRLELEDAKKTIKGLNKTLTLVKDYCKSKEFSLAEIFGVPKKQVYEMTQSELIELNKEVVERQKGLSCPLPPYQPPNEAQLGFNERIRSSLENAQKSFDFGVQEIAKVEELRKKYEADLDTLLKKAEEDHLPGLPKK